MRHSLALTCAFVCALSGGCGAPVPTLTPESPVAMEGVTLELTKGFSFDWGESEVMVKITNDTRSEVIKVKSWSSPGKVSVQDEFGNKYKVVSKGFHDTKLLHPGESFEEGVRFEGLKAECKEVSLIFDGDCINRPGKTISGRTLRRWFRDW